MNITEYLTTEQDKWHRRYNDAEIEIDRLKRENERLEMAIHRLIMERDCAIKDMKHITYNRVGKVPQSMCETCRDLKENCMKFYIRDKEVGCIWNWRGVKR